MQPPTYVPPPLPEALIPLDGTDWNHVEVLRGVDGDTVRLLRAQLTWTLDEECEIGDTLRLTNWRLRVVQDDAAELPKGLAGRLVNLDTPELHSSDPDERRRAKVAAADLAAWVQSYRTQLRCITYDGGGGFDRLLVDLYVLADDGQTVLDSASQHMLRLGWLPYVRGV